MGLVCNDSQQRRMSPSSVSCNLEGKVEIRTSALLTAVALALSLVCPGPGEAIARVTAKADSDTIPRQSALSSIASHKATLQARRKAVDAAYDYFTVADTLLRAFQRNGVTDPAVLDYAKVWGPNIIYLTLDNLHGLYDFHLQQLHLSEQHIKQTKSGSVRQADMDYLAQGMQAWERAERQAVADMDKMTDHFARQAAMLQQQREVQRQIDAAPPAARRNLTLRYEAIGEMAKHHRQQAADIAARLAEVGAKTRLFSAINAVDRIASAPCQDNRRANVAVPELHLIPPPGFSAPAVGGASR